MSRREPRASAVDRNGASRRRAFQWLLLPALQWLLPTALRAATIASARLWPAQEYTRLILESGTPVVHQMLTIRNPTRLVLDLEDVGQSGRLAASGALGPPLERDPLPKAVAGQQRLSDVHIQRADLEVPRRIPEEAVSARV